MGNAYVLWVYEDAVRHAPPDQSKDLKRKQAIGEAVVELCQPRMSRSDPELRSVAVNGQTVTPMPSISRARARSTVVGNRSISGLGTVCGRSTN